MSVQLAGFYFSANADASANDYTLHVEGDADYTDFVRLGARYKNADRNSLYEILLDADDLERFGRMCVAHARLMRPAPSAPKGAKR